MKSEVVTQVTQSEVYATYISANFRTAVLSIELT